MKRNNAITRWWRAVDQQLIVATCVLIAFSFMLVSSTGSSVASKIGASEHYFSSRQILYIFVGIILMLGFSAFNKKWIKRIAILGFVFSILMLIVVKFYGYEVKGATRWIRIRGFSYQPSEFMKPFFSVVIGWILSLKYEEDFPSFSISVILYLTVASLLILQPDFGMLVLTTAVFASQLFVAGLPIIWAIVAAVTGFLGSISAYLLLPHVAKRINSFLDPESGGNYQVGKSMLAYKNGGIYGRGPGEGVVKQHLPDSHTDFIFAVAGEEFGAIICLVIICVFVFIILRTLLKITTIEDKFIQLSAIGIIIQFGLQTAINIGVTLNLLPTKGMTLPFISYGGSSTIAMSIAMGMLLSLTKRRASLVKYKIKHIDI